MAVVRQGKSITMTADADAYTGIVFITGMTFVCGTATPADRLRVLDVSGGSVIADYLVMSATDNADLWGGREGEFYQGVYIEDFPSGTGVLTIITG